MIIAPYHLLPQLPESLSGLGELAIDLRWSWSHATDTLWQQIAPELWEQTRNPWLILQNISGDTLQHLAQDKDFIAKLDTFVGKHHEHLTQKGWFSETYPHPPFSQVAYFSMAFGLSESLPIYSGGLGILAGDCLKTASDLGIPLLGIGLLWQQGYFRQSLDNCGRQIELYPYNDPTQMPVTPVRDAEGEWLRLELPFPGRTVILRAWQAQVGRVTLYLLDSNDPLNAPADRGITAELYGGGPENRLQQEICLGIGGWMLLRRLGIQPDICHLNEGHAALAILARAYSHMQDHGTSFPCALTATRAGNIFTTHTPVSAGFDRFPPELLTRYIAGAPGAFGVDVETILALGRENPEDTHEPFNMAWLAIHGSLIVNGVSRLHGAVSRHLFQSLFPRWPEDEVPVIHVTNGVHMPSWDSAEADALWTNHCGKARWLGDLKDIEADFRQTSDGDLWQLRSTARQQVILFARRRLQKQLAAAHAPDQDCENAKTALDPNTLPIGFARRFTAYKRPNMLLNDPDRLYRLLNNPHYPVQLLIAGKAHPKDDVGKVMIQQWTQFLQQHPDLAGRMVFIADYDMLVAEHLVQGVDLWINTPRRPWEASGTSGMKVLVNGGLNLSELDGWWAEAYEPETGWALGDRQEHDADLKWDQQEAQQLYRLLEEEVVPLFYQQRDANGCPCGWVAKIRESMSRLTPRFSSNRMLQEYVSTLYEPAARLLSARSERAIVEGICQWQHDIRQHWQSLHFGELDVQSDTDTHHFQVHVYLDDLDADAVAVQLFANGDGKQNPEIYEMTRGDALTGAINSYNYTCTVPAHSTVESFTPRIIPHREGCMVPMESNEILWYR
ncbi:alpha-glucan family phosphorylase [Acidithiobacillus ferriphilus]|uniref:alpha-glucan family phosphorylase n=1 Tax=Acidithiobacillus ferriphilus TaxID=1689834 RepID=UPI00242C1605|nr:alpha-glucan family phosphorylase [Acidithiobacillus ferriphilus]MBW9255511.1 alpha-glucan family phosphorylase [Acidithiobacillus ferriphilus]